MTGREYFEVEAICVALFRARRDIPRHNAAGTFKGWSRYIAALERELDLVHLDGVR